MKQRRQGSGWSAVAPHARYSLYLQMIADEIFALPHNQRWLSRLSTTDCSRYSKIADVHSLRAVYCFRLHHVDEILWKHLECMLHRDAHETAQLVFHGIVIISIRPIHEQLIGQSLRVSSGLALSGHWRIVRTPQWNLSMNCSFETGRHVQGWQEQVHNWEFIGFLSVFSHQMRKHHVDMT